MPSYIFERYNIWNIVGIMNKMLILLKKFSNIERDKSR